MTASDKVRHVLAVFLVAGTIITLIITPVSLETLVAFAAVGLAAGVLLVLPGDLVGWIASGILVFGTDWVQSILSRRGAVFQWYMPMLIAVAVTVTVYYIGQTLKPRRQGI